MPKKSKMLKLDEETADVKIALYVRVSTDAQREEGYSVEIQRERLKSFADSMFGPGTACEYYIDDGWSGGSLDRPEMHRLIRNVKDGLVTHVAVYKLDRLSRSQKDTLYLIEDVFLPHNTAFISMQESFNTSTPFGRAVVGILSVFAQLERENIFERTRSGMQKRVEAGYWMGGGRVPYGYDYDQDKGILVPNRDADKVRRVYDLYIKGYSLQRIADLLDLKYEKLAYQIMTRKSNAGYIVYNGVEYKGRHEPIITLETYEKAMALMAERSAKRFISTTDHLLTGLVRCGICGAKMRYQKWGKAGIKLVCYSQQKSKPYLIRDPDCDNAKVWADEIEDIVVGDLFAMTKRDMASDSPLVEPMSALELLRGQYDNAAKRLKRLYNLYADDGDEMLTETIAETKRDLESILDKIRQEEERGLISDSLNRRRDEIRSISDAWEYMTVQERQNAIRSVVERILVTGDNVEVEYKI